MLTTVSHDIDVKKPIYKNDSFTLYKVKNPNISADARPLILLSGNNAETYNSNGNAKITSALVMNEKGFSHANQPYVAVLTYQNHPEYTSTLFAHSLSSCLDQCNISGADIIGKSLGGLIALEMLSLNRQNINHAYLLNTPIYGSLLANRDFLKKELKLIKFYIKKQGLNNLKNINRKAFDYILAFVSLLGSREDCATTKDNAIGVDYLHDLNKFTYFCGDIFENSTINYGNETSIWKPYENFQRFLMELSADYMRRTKNIKSDGTVTFDQFKIKRDGIDFINCPGIDHSKLSSKGYLDFTYKKILERNKTS